MADAECVIPQAKRWLGIQTTLNPGTVEQRSSMIESIFVYVWVIMRGIQKPPTPASGKKQLETWLSHIQERKCQQ